MKAIHLQYSSVFFVTKHEINLKRRIGKNCRRLHQGLSYHSITPLTDPPLANHNPAIFPVLPHTEKRNKSPRQTKSSDNASILHMFNNDTYTDFIIAYKHILIPSYVIQVIEPNQNVTKLNIGCLAKIASSNIWKLSP